MIERQAFEAHTLFLPALCWGRSQPDFHAVTQEISRDGITLRSAVEPEVNQRLSCSIRYIGVVETRVTCSEEHRFVVRLMASRQRITEVAQTMMGLARAQGRSFDAPRIHPRINPTHKDVLVTLEDGSVLAGCLINVSASGAALTLDRMLVSGTPIVIGDTAARVVRTFRDGIGVAFANPLDPAQIHAGIRL